MSKSNPYSIIDLDEDDQKLPESNQKPAVKEVGISASNFPRLHSMLQKHVGSKTKTQQVKRRVETFVPSVIKSNEKESEVCKIVSLWTSQQRQAPAQTPNEPAPPKIISGDSHELYQMVENDLLLVEEALQPLVQIQPTKTKTFSEVIQNERQNHALAQVQNAIEEVKEKNNEQQHNLNDKTPSKIENFCDSEKIQIPFEPHQEVNQIEENHQTISKTNIQLLPDQPILQQNGQNNPSSIIEQKDVNNPINAVPEQPLNTYSQPNEKFTIEQIRFVLKKLLPQMDNVIQHMQSKELIDIYNSVKSDLPENELQKLIDEQSASEQQQCVNTPYIQSKQTPFETQEKKPQMQINMNWNELRILQYLKTLQFQELRVSMKKHFKYQNDLFDQMSYENLMEILNQTIQEFRGKQNNLEQQQPAIQLQKSNEESFQKQKRNQHSNNQYQPRNIQPNPQVISGSISGRPINHTQKQLQIPQIKQFLIENISTIKPEQLEGIRSDYLKMLYEGAKNGRLSRVEIAQNIESASSQAILQKSIQKFPHLESQLNKVNQQEVQVLITSFSKSNNALNNGDDQVQILQNFKPKEPPSIIENPNYDYHSQKNSELDEEAGEIKPHKRTHDEMLSTNPRKNEEGRSEFKHRSPHKVRQKLIARLPDLKDNIMKLDDNQIERIYKQSFENNRASRINKNKRDQEGKPMILMKDKKLTNTQNKSESGREDQRNISDTILQNSYENGKIIQINSESKKKKSRTIIFVHTEQLSDDEAGNSFKIKKKQNGIEKKDSCECFQKASIGQLLKKIVQLVEKKS